jgi:hypothetical protein
VAQGDSGKLLYSRLLKALRIQDSLEVRVLGDGGKQQLLLTAILSPLHAQLPLMHTYRQDAPYCARA